MVLPDLVIHSYRGVCACVNVLKFVHFIRNWSIDNHGNSLFAYFEPNCGAEFWTALYIEAGRLTKSRGMHTHTRKHGENILKIYHFGHDPSSEYYSLSGSPCSYDEIMKLEHFKTFSKSTFELPACFFEIPKLLTTRKDNYNLINFSACDNFKGKR